MQKVGKRETGATSGKGGYGISGQSNGGLHVSLDSVTPSGEGGGYRAPRFVERGDRLAIGVTVRVPVPPSRLSERRGRKHNP